MASSGGGIAQAARAAREPDEYLAPRGCRQLVPGRDRELDSFLEVASALPCLGALSCGRDRLTRREDTATMDFVGRERLCDARVLVPYRGWPGDRRRRGGGGAR